MPYNPIADSEIDPDSPITTGLMTNLRDNPIGIANGDVGAPQIQAAAIASAAVTNAKIANSAVTAPKIAALAVEQSKLSGSSVGQAQLRTATVNLAGTIGNTVILNIVMNAYAFFPMIHTSSQASVTLRANNGDLASPDSPTFAISNQSGASITYDVDYRHIVA